MAKERPQLSLIELHQLRWLLGGLLALVSVGAVWYLEIDATFLLVVTTFAAVATLVRPTLPARWPSWGHRLAFPFAVSVLAFDLYTYGEFLPALVRLAVLLLLYRVTTYRKRRDDLQLILLGLFLIVTTGVLTVSMAFALQIVVFTALALGLLLTRTLVDAAEGGRNGNSDTTSEVNRVPAWATVRWRVLLHRLAAVSDWRVWGLSIVLFGGLVGLSALLFLVIPRFQLDGSLFLDRWMNKRSVSGFTDTLRFGEVSDIQKDESVAMSVEVSDRTQVPSDLYWRMVVLDEYQDRAFRMSGALRATAMGDEVTRKTIESVTLWSNPHQMLWTFYLEPGVSRHLPLLGGFQRLVFTEPQTFRASFDLRMVSLARDPSIMKAYEVHNMDAGAVLIEPQRWNHYDNPQKAQARQRAHELLETLPAAYTEDERQQWQRTVQEITGGAKLPPKAFAREAIAWLHRHHSYALQNQLPKGEGDPLLRWAMSEQPGHCELFAGAFTMLARAAGIPTRVIAGFVGGAWNEDFLVVRNSNAHAWCEIQESPGHWMRIDPTVPPTTDNPSALAQAAIRRGLPTEETGWSARFDRLRMMWYRRVVHFDRSDQLSLTQTLKDTTESSSKRLRAWIAEIAARVHAWATKPWDWSRWTATAGAAILAAVLLVGWRTIGRSWWWRWQSHRGRGADPVRREAGRWLKRFEELPHVSRDAEANAMVEALQRLRYGQRASWPSPETIFRQARRVFRNSRRAAMRTE